MLARAAFASSSPGVFGTLRRAGCMSQGLRNQMANRVLRSLPGSLEGLPDSLWQNVGPFQQPHDVKKNTMVALI